MRKRDVLISIKPKYVSKILTGEKRVEFRKRIFKEEVENVIVYSSSPEKRIVGYFKYEGCIIDSPKSLWEETKEIGGIEEKDYFNYFENREKSYAIKINKFNEYNKHIDPKEIFNNFIAPQSFKYIEHGVI